MEEFELTAFTEAMENFAGDLRATIEEAEQRAYESSLDVYYAAEELARDPANAYVVPHVEAMRAAHRQSYGRPIPTKEETERRRRRCDAKSAGEDAGAPGTAVPGRGPDPGLLAVTMLRHVPEDPESRKHRVV